MLFIANLAVELPIDVPTLAFQLVLSHSVNIEGKCSKYIFFTMKNAANNFTLSIYDHLATKHTLIDLWTFLSVAHITCVTALHKKK